MTSEEDLVCLRGDTPQMGRSNARRKGINEDTSQEPVNLVFQDESLPAANKLEV